MLLGQIEKQPAERQNYFISYSEYLQENEIIISAVGTLDKPDELHLIGPLVMDSNKDIEFWLEDGVHGVMYKLEVNITTNLGNIKQDEIRVKIKEI